MIFFVNTTDTSPSANRLTKLSVGDEVKLWCGLGKHINVKVAFVRGNKVAGEDAEGFLHFFEKRHIFEIVPALPNPKLKPCLLVGEPDDYLVLYTVFPRMIAKVNIGAIVTAEVVKYIDLPESEAQEKETLKQIANWYYYKHLKHG